ncbi:MAG: hypothetical protein OES34_08090 [Nitrosopumilus sp.]|nr:hypothetical protein [Nitrosopumilus sp.]
MKIITTFGLLILVASMVLGGMTSNVSAQDSSAQDSSAQDSSAQDSSAQDSSAQDSSAQDSSTILLKVAKRAQKQIQNQISTDSSDKVKRLFEEGTKKVNALEESLRDNDNNSAKEYFLSAMKIFTEISRQLTTPNATPQAETDSVKPAVKDPSNDLKRLQVYVNSIKTIAKKYNTSIDSELDGLFTKARQLISDHQFTLASETLHEIKETIVEVNKELRQEASKQESQRAKEYAQRYLEQLDRLIENAKKQDVANEIIEKLETAKENLSLAENPSKIIEEIRKIMNIKDQFKLTAHDRLESRVLQVEQTLSKLSQVDGIDQDDLSDTRTILQSIKGHLSEGESDRANELLRDLAKQLQEIKNSL